MNLVINYAAIGFRPYAEIGEYVNVGVVAVEARSRYLSYRLLSAQKTKRIAVCFPEIDLSIYRSGLKRLESELAALSIETNQWADDAKQAGTSHPAQSDLFVGEGDNDLFKRLTSLRGSPFFYASHGTRLTNDVDECLKDVYGRYVEHWNLTPADYEEKKLTRDIKRLLHANNMDRFYKEASWVGTDAYHVGIPLAFTPKGSETPEKAIKAINLAQSSPTKIYMHGDEWISKLKRLKSIGSLPQSFLFVAKKPEDPECAQAAEEICEGLSGEGAQVVDIRDHEGILDFARIEENPELELEFE